MSIWGRRDSEPAAEEANEGQAAAHDTQEPAAEHQAGGPAPAMNEAPPGTDAPVPVLTGVVVDAETAVKDPASTGAQQPPENEDQAGAQGAGASDPAVTEAQEPTMVEPRDQVQEPAMTQAQEPAVAEPWDQAQEPAMTGTEQQAVAPEPTVTDAGRPAVAPATASSADAAAAPASSGGIPAQRWSEILVTFVDDPRGSVKMAADAVDEAIDEFVNSVRVRQRDLASTWQSAEADTEQLRSALREYRKLGQRVQQLDLGEKTGG